MPEQQLAPLWCYVLRYLNLAFVVLVCDNSDSSAVVCFAMTESSKPWRFIYSLTVLGCQF